MKPLRQRIIDRVKAAHEAIEGVGDVDIERAGDPVEFPAWSIEDHGDQLLANNGYSLRWRMKLSLVGDVEARPTADGEPPLPLEDLYQAMIADNHVAVMADQQWSGLASRTELGLLDIGISEGADARAATVTREVFIDYAVKATDPRVQSE